MEYHENFEELLLYELKVSTIRFKSCKIKSLKIQNSQISEIVFDEKTHIDNLLIASSAVNFKLGINSDSQVNIITLRNSQCFDFQIYKSFVNFISIENSNIGDLRFYSTDVNNLIISRNSIVGRFIYHSELKKPAKCFFTDSTIYESAFKQAIFPQFNIFNYSNCKIQSITMEEIVNFGSIIFNNIIPIKEVQRFKKIKEQHGFEYYDLNEKGFYETETYEKKSDLKIIDSDLGKTSFIGCDLRKFDSFTFCNSKILEVFVAGTRLPEKIEVPEKINKNEQERLAFGQFKKIYESRGDTPMALRYLGFEMKAYKALLNKEKNEDYPITGSYLQNKSESFLLFMNRISNNFGTNWLRGVGCTLISGSICYIIFCLTLGFRFGNFDNINDWEVFKELASFAPQYLNPLRGTDSGLQVFKEATLLSKVEMNFWARLWDYFSRVIVAYFVYQTIQAFRKLGKSSG